MLYLIQASTKQNWTNLNLFINKHDTFLNRVPDEYNINSNRFVFNLFSSQKNLVVRLIPFLSLWILKIRKFDVVFISSDFAALTPYLKSKTIFYPTCSDLTKAPFAEMNPKYQDSPKIRRIFIRTLLNIQAINIQKGIRNASTIVVYPWTPYRNALEKIQRVNLARNYLPIA